MIFIPTGIPGVIMIEPAVHGDARGFFFETWRSDAFAEHGIAERFVQENTSRSRRGTLRGLHLQHPHGQGKLVRAVRGSVFDVAVDVRRNSPTFGAWFGCELSDENKRQLWIPSGFAHGFCVTSDIADIVYKCSEYFHPECEMSVQWNDPAIGITWPLDGAPLLSSRDSAAQPLALQTDLPTYAAESS